MKLTHSKLKSTLSLILTSGLLFSCATSMTGELELRHYHNGKNHSGVVVYNPHGTETLVNERKEEAYKRAKDFCAPAEIQIKSEQRATPREREASYQGVANQLYNQTLVFIDFECSN